MKAPLKHALPTITTTGRYILRNLNGPSPYTFIIGQLCRINRAGRSPASGMRTRTTAKPRANVRAAKFSFNCGPTQPERALRQRRPILAISISRKDRVMAHKFNIGQNVDLMPKVLRAAPLGPYQIRFLVPASDKDPSDPHYRIKSVAEKHERVASESELTLSESAFA
jgi:hypothetical protein